MNNSAKIIGIVVALPEERVALVKVLHKPKRRLVEGIPFYGGTLQGRPVCVVEGGMGTAAASRATRALITETAPSLVISAGFCGALRPEQKVADLVVSRQLCAADEQGLHQIPLAGGELSAARLSAELQSKGLRTWQGTFVTTSRIVTKAAMAAELPEQLPVPVLEMESAAVAQVTAAAGVPFLGLRSISDTADEELDFTLDELTDKQFQISIPRVLLTCLKKPRIIPQLARLAANSGKAGKALGAALQQLLPLL